MKPPIFIATADGVMIFESPDAASRYLEPIDVDNGEYRSAWDSGGRRLQIAVKRTPVRRKWFGVRDDEVVVIREQATLEPEALQDALRAYAADGGLEMPSTVSLDEAIAIVRERYPFGVLMRKHAT
jgi:hypothetical protein